MSRYNAIIYGADDSKYGEISALGYSVEPLLAEVIDYSTVNISWTTAQGTTLGTILRYKLLRNQFAYPETSDDGIVVFDSETPAAVTVTDTESLSPGKFAFYRMWLQVSSDNSWIPAGDTSILIPREHASAINPSFTDEDGERITGNIQLRSTHEKFLSYLPKIFTNDFGPTDPMAPPSTFNATYPSSPSGYALSEKGSVATITGASVSVDGTTVTYVASNDFVVGDSVSIGGITGGTNAEKFNLTGTVASAFDYQFTVKLVAPTTLSQFLRGFSFTIDEFLSYTDLILPGVTGAYSNQEILALQSHQVGMENDAEGLTKAQKRLVREAVNLYEAKGTVSGITNLVKAITGYPCTVSASDNLMLSIQDSSFIKGVGNWVAGQSTTTVTSEEVGSVTGLSLPTKGATDLVSNEDYVGKVSTVGTGTHLITNGAADPIHSGIPVTAGQTYYFTYKVKGIAGSGVDIANHYFIWYDKNGKQIQATTAAGAQSVTTSWASKSLVGIAPSTAVFAAVAIQFASVATTYYLTRCQITNYSTAVFSEARAAKIFVNPTKYNLLTQPSFELADNTAWETNYGVTTLITSTLTTAKAGSKMINYVASGTISGPDEPTLGTTGTLGTFNKNTFYTFSIYANSTTAVVPTMDLNLGMFATSTVGGGIVDISNEGTAVTVTTAEPHGLAPGQQVAITGVDGGVWEVPSATILYNKGPKTFVMTVLSSEVDTYTTGGFVKVESYSYKPTPVPNEWTRVHNSVLIPGYFDTSTTNIRIAIWGSTNMDDVVQFDCAQLEAGVIPSDYFDGSMTSSGATWTGTEKDSISAYYPNRASKIARIGQEIVNYLPINKAYEIRSLFGVESTGISS
jgi:hypothetical protein